MVIWKNFLNSTSADFYKKISLSIPNHQPTVLQWGGGDDAGPRDIDICLTLLYTPRSGGLPSRTLIFPLIRDCAELAGIGHRTRGLISISCCYVQCEREGFTRRGGGGLQVYTIVTTSFFKVQALAFIYKCTCMDGMH